MNREAAKFLGLLALSALFAGGFLLVDLPAALLIGPMMAAVICAISGYAAPLHHRLPIVAQTVIGQLMAHSLTLDVLREIIGHWDIFLGGVFSVIIMSFALGWLLARLRVMPGSAALWGSSPGAASAMVLLCENYGADQRLVAFMLYLRVILVTLATSVVAHVVSHGTTHIIPHTPLHDLVPACANLSFCSTPPLWPTLVIIAIATFGARHMRFAAAPLLLSMVGGLLIQTGLGIHYTLPYWLLAPSYVVLGWMIGRRFTAGVLRHVRHSLFAVALSSSALIAGCALLAWPLSRIAHVDILSAYLATSPGGADSVAIIAASNSVDMPFVMAMQIARFMILLALAPLIATTLARVLPKGKTGAAGQTSRNTDSA